MISPLVNLPQKSAFNYAGIKSYFRWIFLHWKFVVISGLACLVLGMAMYYYKPATYVRTSKITMKYDAQGNPTSTDLLAFSNIALIGNGISFSYERHLVNSYVVWDVIVSGLKLNYEYYKIGKLGKRTLMYRTSPVEVVFGEPDERHLHRVSFSMEKTGGSQVELSDFKIDGETADSDGIIANMGKTVETPVGKLVIHPTVEYPDFDYKLKFYYTPKSEVIPYWQEKIVQDATDQYSTVLQNTLVDISPKRAEDILNMIPVAYDRVWNMQKDVSAKSLSSFVSANLRNLQAELDAVEKEVARYMEGNNLVSFPNAVMRQYGDVAKGDSILFEIGMEQDAVGFLEKQLSENSDGELLAAVGDVEINTQVQAYNELLLKKEGFILSGGSEHPEMNEIGRATALLKKNISKSLSEYGRQLEIRKAKAGAARREAINRIPGLSKSEKKLVDLQRSIEIKGRLVRYLNEKEEACKLSAQMDPHPVRIIMVAYGDDDPSSLSLGIVALISLAFGLGVVPVAGAYMHRMLNYNVENASDLEGYSFSLIGEIPQGGKITLKNKLCNLLHIEYKEKKTPTLLVTPNSTGLMRESFLRLGSALDFMLMKNNEKPAIMTTSFNPGSGKTFVLLNLAASISLGKKKVLLVDLDIRRASLSEFVNLPGKNLVSYLTGKNGMNDIIAHTEIPGVDIIPAFRKTPPNPVELLESPLLDSLIREMKQHYDYIFMDCPPIDIIADTSISARLANRTMFVVRCGLLDKRLLPELDIIYRQNEYPNMSVILNGLTTPPIY